MSKVRRVRVEIEIEDDDGEVTVHEAEGVPRPPTTASVIPHYRDQYSRRAGGLIASEIVDVAVRLDCVLRPGDSTLFRIVYPDTPVLAITERTLADNLTSRSLDPVVPIRDQSGEAS